MSELANEKICKLVNGVLLHIEIIYSGSIPHFPFPIPIYQFSILHSQFPAVFLVNSRYSDPARPAKAIP